MKSSVGLKQNGPLQARSSLNRGNSRLSGQTRIKAHAASSGRTVDGEELWSLRKADQKISKYVRGRDKKCLLCSTSEFLTCSHFHGRNVFATRFDPDNLITLCLYCHMRMETEKKGEYHVLMIAYLGIPGLRDLNRRARVDAKKEDAIIACMRFFKELSVSK